MVRAVLENSGVMRARRRRSNAGFTLVELSIVVVIIGVLAVLALVGYRKYMTSSKITEAKAVIGAIRIAQEDYRAEKGSYANNGTTFCPDVTEAGGGVKKVGWDPACMQVLPVHVSGPVLFKYATTAGTGTFSDDFAVSGWVASTSIITPPWYAIDAKCDMDGDGADPTELFATSYGNEIFSRNEGL